MTNDVAEDLTWPLPLDTPPDQVLRQARYLLVSRGWTRSAYVNEETGAVCAWGAIYGAFGFEGDNGVTREDLEWIDDVGSYLVDLVPEVKDDNRAFPGDALVWWNDQRERTADEVLSLYDKAIWNATEGTP